MISLAMIAVQAVLCVVFILVLRRVGFSLELQAAGPAMALCAALGLASIAKAKLLSRLLGEPVSGWRWALVWASGAAIVVGSLFTMLPPSLEWLELLGGIPAILGIYGLIIWRKGFGPNDRALFAKKKA